MLHTQTGANQLSRLESVASSWDYPECGFLESALSITNQRGASCYPVRAAQHNRLSFLRRLTSRLSRRALNGTSDDVKPRRETIKLKLGNPTWKSSHKGATKAITGDEGKRESGRKRVSCYQRAQGPRSITSLPGADLERLFNIIYSLCGSQRCVWLWGTTGEIRDIISRKDGPVWTSSGAQWLFAMTLFILRLQFTSEHPKSISQTPTASSLSEDVVYRHTQKSRHWQLHKHRETGQFLRLLASFTAILVQDV